MYKHNGLLKASIMSATNAHRPGANEAPPAIISTFLGTQVSAVLDKPPLEGRRRHPFRRQERLQDERHSHIPTLLLDNTDRNRTSPFAFTGNRFEFRAVGSSDNCAEAMIALNTAMASELTEFRKAVDAKIESGIKKEKAIYEVLKQMIKACKAIRFRRQRLFRGVESRGEEARAGLRDFDAADLRPLHRQGEREAVQRYGRLYEGRARSPHRGEVGDLHQEDPDRGARAGRSGDESHRADRVEIRSAAARQGLQDVADRGLDASSDIRLIKKIQNHTAEIQRLTGEMIDARKVANKIEEPRAKAIAYHDTVAVCFDEIRRHMNSKLRSRRKHTVPPLILCDKPLSAVHSERAERVIRMYFLLRLILRYPVSGSC